MHIKTSDTGSNYHSLLLLYFNKNLLFASVFFKRSLAYLIDVVRRAPFYVLKFFVKYLFDDKFGAVFGLKINLAYILAYNSYHQKL